MIAPFLLHMFEIGDIVSVKTDMIDGYPYGRTSIGGLFPVNREFYEVVASLGNGIYVIGIGNLAIAAVRKDDISLTDAESAWDPVDVCGKVYIRHGARNYMGYLLPAYVYGQEYTIVNVVCDRVLISNANHTIAIKGEDVII